MAINHLLACRSEPALKSATRLRKGYGKDGFRVCVQNVASNLLLEPCHDWDPAMYGGLDVSVCQ